MAHPYLDYEVHSNYINVGAGDGCIHFLMNKKKIERAIIIDGGDDDAKQATFQSFKALRDAYKKLDPSNADFKLDTIVITHWDGDHYRALTSVLYDDFVDHNEESTLIGENAVFYCPWTAMGKIQNTRWRVDNETLYFLVGSIWHEICPAVTSTNCLGYDLFTNKPVYGKPSKKWTSIASLTDVYKLSTLKKLERPIFLVVGVDDYFINESPWTAPVKSWIAANKGARVINGASLMATVIWPSAIGEYRVSLYTGGDAEEACERCLLEWMERGRNLLKKEVRLDVVKMGHHGSHFALPENIVKFQNKAFVVSAGSRHGHPSYSVLFYLLGIADMMKKADKATKLSPFRIYGTRKPYWMDMGADELSRVHLNVNTILSYTGGTAVVWNSMLDVLKFTKNGQGDQAALREELNKMLQNAVGESMRHMKNLFWLKNAGDLSGLATIADGDTILNQYKGWKPPKKSVILDPEGEYAEAVNAAQQRIQQQWAEHKCEPGSGDADIRFVAIKATSYGVECKTVERKAKAIWDGVVKTAARSGASSLPLAADAHKFGGNQKVFIKNKFLGLVSATAVTDDVIEEWTHGLLFNDIKKAQDQPGSNFPKTGRFDRHELLGNSSDVALWLNQCFPNAVTLKVSGSTDEAEKIVLDMMDILISPRFQGTGTPSSEPIHLAFTTDQQMRSIQFGQVATSLPQTIHGYDRRLQGFLFALDNAQTSGNMTLAQFSELINFPLPPLVKGILSMVKLRPAPARSASGTEEYGGPDCRSGIWFMPCHDLRVIFRMAMELDHGESSEVSASASTSAVEKLLEESGFACTVSDVLITGTSVSEALLAEHKRTRSVLGFQAKLTINTSKQVSASQTPLSGVSVAAGITFTDRGFEVKLVMHDKTFDILSALLQWCQSLITQGSDDHNDVSSFDTATDDIVSSVKDAFDTIFKHVNIRSVVIGFEGESDAGTSSPGRMPKPSYFTINIETTFLQNDKVPFLTSLSWSQGVYSLSCKLWHHSSTFDVGGTPLAIQPYSDLGNLSDINPMTKGCIGSLSIKDLIGKPDLVLPSGIPSTVSEARLDMSFGGGRKTIFLEGAVECLPEIPERGSLPPVFRFSQLHAALNMTFASGGTDFDLAFDAVTEVRLPKNYKPDESHGAVDDVIAIETRVEYNKERSDSSWTIAGKVKNLKMAHLYDLFAADGSNDAIRDLMGGIHLDYVFISYEYHKEYPGKFELDGIIVLGSPNNGLELKLEYTHIGKSQKGEEQEDSRWFFRAGAMAAMDKEGPTPKDRTFKIATLLEGLVDDVDDLPEIVHSMEIPLSALEANLACSRVPGAEKGENHAVFALTITVTTQSGKFAVTLAQIRSFGGNKNKDESKPLPGRLLRFSLSNLNSIQVPVVGNGKPPFDQVGVVWTNRDITPAEIAVLNEQVFTNDPLLVKTPAGDAGADAGDKGLLLKGFHFQVALLEGSRPNLILDHVVGGKVKEPKKNMALTAVGEAAAAPSSKDKTVAPMAKTFGPLTVRNIGLSVSGKRYSTISLFLDATVQLGPLSFALLGFTITLDLSVLTNPDKLASIITKVGIHGMAVAYDRPPTRIAGMVSEFDDPGISKGFQGAIAVSLSTWSALAGGRYEELYPKFTTKSFSLFGMVQGPIAEFGAAEINGLTGGFGYNSRLQIPADASGVANFPFIALNRSGSQGGSAMEQMNLILDGGARNVISPAREAMWFVAGIGIKAFQTFEGQAIFALTLDEHPKFAVLATATAVFPKPPKGISSSDDPFKGAFAVVDIAMSCVIDPFHGTVIATGELTPISFVMDKECKLTGSFALAYFLPNSPYDGDFVFSVGGYHRDFEKPSHYPDVKYRVGIAWNFDKHLSIKGESYFAITPHAVMGGGRLDMIFDKRFLGDKLWVNITFTAYADFLMKFHPFYFQLDVTVVFSARGSIDLWLYTQNLGPLSLTASLSLWGPPLAGIAKLSLWTYKIEVAFGPSLSKPRPLNLEQFVRIAKNLPAEESGSAKNVPNHIVSVIAGKVKAGEGANTGPIEISAAGVLVQVQSRIPVLSSEISGYAEPRMSTVKNSKGEDVTPRILARPMLLEQPFKQSLLRVTLRRSNSSDTIDLDANPLIQSLPPALWGENIETPNLASLKAPMIPHVVGYTVSLRPKSDRSEDIPAVSVTEFNAVDVGKDPAYHVPPIKRATPFEDDESFRLAGDAATKVENDGDEEELKEKKAKRRKKRDAFAAWDRFKRECSGGGLAKEVQLGKIFSATQRVAT
ncbi:uncharacterized protein TRIREDRAFT_109373 [Trichoderma reesei QM6a]|uniref:Predicted protein n=1 Tax=Hypocrea jecorina (strain QM6a) TaxID=431241 RepID=G0RP21_HYPJQ|nr:uncharacterized protein TRIREDRAFT_109373 [Trichoderma reesei QM6a]EGR47010.1 predicted protein [Trichoderma reesei QM6a]